MWGLPELIYQREQSQLRLWQSMFSCLLKLGSLGLGDLSGSKNQFKDMRRERDLVFLVSGQTNHKLYRNRND